MKQFQSSQSFIIRALVAVSVVVALGSVIHVATRASTEAVASKKEQFDAAEEIQIAARERKGTKLAQSKR